jgi:arsenite transporter
VSTSLAMAAFGPQGSVIALVIALFYIVQVQVQAAAWYVKFSDRLFGPVPIEGAVS